MVEAAKTKSIRFGGEMRTEDETGKGEFAEAKEILIYFFCWTYVE